MKISFKPFIFIYLSFLVVSCNNDDIPNPSLTILEDKITCEYCFGDFGYIIEADNNELVISGGSQAYIFEWLNQNLELKQTIDFNPSGGILSIFFKNDDLLIGGVDDYGTGSVFIYEKKVDKWEMLKELTIGRDEDSFGSSIDMSAEYLVIGAYAPYIDEMGSWVNVDEGRIHIYKKSATGWELDSEFRAIDSHGGDRFGESIAIQGKYVLAGSCCVPTHIYQLEGEWEFLRTEPIYNSKIIHHNNNFLATNTMSYDSAIFTFKLKENGDFEYSTISFDYSEHERSGHGEILDMYESNSIFSLEMHNYCFTMEYFNNEWTNINKSEPDDNECYVMLGIEITENKIYMGGESYEEGWKDIVYIIDY